MKYYIIAGEASGDLHGSNLIKALHRQDPEADVRCWGGDRMQAAGATLVRHYKELSFMGFSEVLANIKTILDSIRYCKKDIEAFAPDVVIFIDYSGFNLRIARWAKARGYRTQYYISPQVWASRSGRVKKIKRDIDRMYVILPFEKAFYEEEHDFHVDFVGHPLLDALADIPEVDEKHFRAENGLHPDQPIIALLPGSRKQELEKIFPIMLAVTDRFPEYQFVIAGAPSLDEDYYRSLLGGRDIPLLFNATYELLSQSYAALVTSGTATLETALLKVPQVVCYKGNWVSYQIAKRIITLDYISLVNLILKREVVRELIQKELNTSTLEAALHEILDGPRRELQFEAYFELEQKLGGRGASQKAASLIIDSLQ